MVCKFGTHILSKKPRYEQPSVVIQEHGGETWADDKHDGYRVQVQKSPTNLWLFSNNSNLFEQRCFPDIVETCLRLPVGIFECEFVVECCSSNKECFDRVCERCCGKFEGISDKTVEKCLNSGKIEKHLLSLRVFDVLRWGKRCLMDLPWRERRKYVEKLDFAGIKPVEYTILKSVEEIEAHLRKILSEHKEGFVCKNPNSIYVPGSETTDWVKFKKYETLDLTVVGFYRDCSGRLPFSNVLCAVYNPATGLYETLTKVSVVRDNFADLIYTHVKDNFKIDEPKNLVLSTNFYNNPELPFYYINPDKSIVLEINAMNINFTKNWHSCGLFNAEVDGKSFSLRIAHVKRLREDKIPKQSTTTQQIVKLFELQEGKSN